SLQSLDQFLRKGEGQFTGHSRSPRLATQFSAERQMKELFVTADLYLEQMSCDWLSSSTISRIHRYKHFSSVLRCSGSSCTLLPVSSSMPPVLLRTHSRSCSLFSTSITRAMRR
ncbi:unnamed protein product, partial [Scytosiphon promiscuus]